MKTIAFTAGLLIAASVVSASPPAIPNTPAAVDDVLYTRTFVLEEPFKFIWCKERPHITTGTLLVLEVDKALVVPRAVAMPVLYVGDQTAQRLNHGHQSGHVIAIVPGEVDLAKTPIWFGSPALPADVDAETAKAEHQRANQAGIKPFSAETVAAAQTKGGDRIEVSDMGALLRDHVAELVLEYCPDEKQLADDFRVPVVTKKKPEKPQKDED